MIYTFTLNPSIDYLMELDNLKIGDINRSKNEYIKVGGKGINVSMVLKEQGTDSVACGLIAGSIGNMIENQLKLLNINSSFVTVKGNSRINVKIMADCETAINGKGCVAELNDIDKLCNTINTNDSDYIVLSGSICSGLDATVYSYIMEKLKGRFIVDACGDLFKNTLPKRPFIVKPNHIELGEIFNCQINSFDDAFKYGERLCLMGAMNVIVSMGKMGAVFVNGNEKYAIKANKIEVKNTVGAGDSMVAGFIHSIVNGADYKTALEFAEKVAENKISLI